jgi:hypothetical protein
MEGMLSVSLDTLTGDHLEELARNGVRESRGLEFKQALAVSNDEQKREFLADVTALANSGGGDLIYGVEEDDGAAVSVRPLESFDPDAGCLRLEETIRNGVQPRILGIKIHPVELEQAGDFALVIRVPNSLHRPHMVSFRGTSRFFSRNSSGKYQMDVHELRASFLASHGIAEQIRDFRKIRLNLVAAGEFPIELKPSPRMVLHVLPLASFDPSFEFDYIAARKVGEIRPMRTMGYSPSVNFDGSIVVSNGLQGGAGGYAQLFRNGAIEFVDTNTLTQPGIIPAVLFEQEFVRALTNATDFLRKCSMEPPFAVGVSLLLVHNRVILRGSQFADHGAVNKLENLIVPEMLMESYEIDAPSFLRPSFDRIWNAFGMERSFNYDDSGIWKPGP